MATTYSTREQALAGLTKQKDEARIALNKAIKERKITDSRDITDLPEYDRFAEIERQLRGVGPIGEIGTGLMSTLIGGVTGIPDLVSPALNFAKNRLFSTGSRYPDIPQLYPMAMKAAGVSSEPTSTQAAPAFYGPDVALGVYGIGSLLKSGFKGAKSFLKDRKLKAFEATLPPDEANFFREFMLKGQGSSDPRIAAILQKLSSNPEFAETFSVLQAGATKAATAGMAPRPSRLSPEEATKGLITGVQDKLDALKKARADAGEAAFSKIAQRELELGGDRGIVDTTNTLKQVRELKARFADGLTESSKKAVNFLQTIEDTLTSNNKLTVQQTQSILHEFGVRAAKGESLVNDLAISDQKVIAATIFGGMKDDLRASAALTKDVNDQKSIGNLISARKQIKDASEAYTTAISQGMPSFLQNKSLAEISPEELSKVYSSLTPTQQNVFRSYVGDTKKEALQFLDRNTYTSFIEKATKQLPDGTRGVDLGEMAKNWATLSPSDKNALAAALGQNVNEFSSRMKDALIFSRRMSVSQPVAESVTGIETVGKDLARAGGVAAGYSVYQGIQLTKDAIKALAKTGLSEEETLRILLTPEGASFLKNAAMSPASTKTLEALTAVKAVDVPAAWKGFPLQAAAVGMATKGPEAAPPTPEIPEGTFPEIPAGTFETTPAEAAPPAEGMPEIPEGVFGAPVSKFASTPAEKDRAFILNSELQKANARLQAATTPEEQARAQGDIDALNREIGGLK